MENLVHSDLKTKNKKEYEKEKPFSKTVLLLSLEWVKSSQPNQKVLKNKTDTHTSCIRCWIIWSDFGKWLKPLTFQHPS